MDFLGELSQVKLKKTKTKDYSKIDVEKIKQCADMAQKYRKSQVDVMMDKWYTQLKDFTFRTIFIPFPKNIALHMISMYEKIILKKKKKSSTTDSGISSINKQWIKDNILNESINPGITEFANMIDYSIMSLMNVPSGKGEILDINASQKMMNSHVKTIGSNAKGVFMKLTVRSPKDVQKTCEKDLFDLFNQELSKFDINMQKEKPLRMIAVTKAATHLLSVSSSFQVFDLLIRSKRVYEDFVETYIDFDKDENPVQLVLREWDDSLDVMMEFRGFVNKGKLNALSQYNHLDSYEPISQNHQIISNGIKQFHESKIQPQLDIIGLDQYVIDFVVKMHPNDIIQGIQVIELNPFEPSTGSCLFDWKTDTGLFENGPFQFRYVPSDTSIETKEKRLMEMVSEEYQKYL